MTTKELAEQFDQLRSLVLTTRAVVTAFHVWELLRAIEFQVNYLHDHTTTIAQERDTLRHDLVALQRHDWEGGTP